jgi:primosomal protein N' (replication factor Y)
LKFKGFGTEKINEELEILFPKAKISRMDLDTTRSKNAYQQIIQDFETRKIDILVGTQMVTKGLDFNHVSIVGILNADNLISFPDFRSFERSFQTLAQVSGRAGRKSKRGKVIIQTFNPYHSVIRYVMTNDYQTMFQSQIQERQLLKFPPVCRMIKISVKHTDAEILKKGADFLAQNLRKNNPHQILGPEYPMIMKIKNWLIKDIWIKLNKSSNLKEAKKRIETDLNILKKTTGFSSIKYTLTIDPY